MRTSKETKKSNILKTRLFLIVRDEARGLVICVRFDGVHRDSRYGLREPGDAAGDYGRV